MQAAHLGIEIAQPGGQPRNMARRAKRVRPRMRRSGALEGNETAAARSVGGKLEQRMLGRLDLGAAVEFRIGAKRVVDDGLADVDELPAEPGVVEARPYSPALMMPTIAVRSCAR